MRVLNDTLFNNIVTSQQYGESFKIEHMFGFSVQAVWDVQTPQAAVFVGGIASTAEIQDLTYTANSVGEAGDDITITYVDSEEVEAGSEVVTVDGTDIIVEIEEGVSTAAQIKAAVEGDTTANALVSITVTGTDSNAQSAVAATPLAGGQDSDLNLTANTITVPAGHGFVTGLKGALTSSDTPPTGLSATDYYVIKVDENAFKLASSLSNALAGTAEDITGEGVGTHTFTASSIAGGSVKVQATNDDAEDPNTTPVWSDIGSAQTVSSDGSYMFVFGDSFYKYVRVAATATAGLYALTAKINAKGY